VTKDRSGGRRGKKERGEEEECNLWPNRRDRLHFSDAQREEIYLRTMKEVERPGQAGARNSQLRKIYFFAFAFYQGT